MIDDMYCWFCIVVFSLLSALIGLSFGYWLRKKDEEFEDMSETVKFKSIPEVYYKEMSGVKPNTVREVDIADPRFKILLEWKPEDELFIEITNTAGDCSFTRLITDVTFWKNLVIISWRYPI